MWNWKLSTLFKWIIVLGVAIVPTALLISKLGKYGVMHSLVCVGAAIALYLMFDVKITRQHWTKKG